MAAERLSAAAVGEIVKRYATAVGLGPGNQRSNPRDAGNRQTFLRAKYQLTIYDAANLELAKRTGLPLATLDGDLRKAALAAGVALLSA
jgi:hypothetical protein